jgi:histidinol-phosphatase (PHP family)
MNVFIGIETGYCDLPSVKKRYAEMINARRPDYVINSVHGRQGEDYCRNRPFYQEDGKTLRPKREVYEEYFGLIKRSICQTDYPYDIVGHVGYCARYAPYEDYSISVREFEKDWEEILKEIIRRDKILEVNTSDRRGRFTFLPCEDVLKLYYDLGGRKVSFGSDAHQTPRILDRWDKVIQTLKKIGFTHLTLPCRGEHIKLEI